MHLVPFLIIGRGDPYPAGSRLELTRQDTVLGRSSAAATVDLHFDNYLISRSHCRIVSNAERAVLIDLGSKHGTAVNGSKLIPLQEYVLHVGDTISLASGVVTLRFSRPAVYDETLDLSSPLPVITKAALALEIDADKEECRADGYVVPLTSKEWLLLSVLHQHSGKLVSYDCLKLGVWPERLYGASGIPDVGPEEMNLLVYRLRKKLGIYAGRLKTVRGRGCILEKT